jgi:nitrite reductase/ring-hydroxylating ferredoxin subunit/DMSO/TMAO reductase YedYZ heme-binding membrane subunit
MSVSYSAVGWNRQKKIYDAVVFAVVCLIIASFNGAAYFFHQEITVETLLIRSLSIAAIVLLHFVLAIGPLARIDRRFLPVLYNRRHLGVVTFCLGLLHALLSVFQFHALGNVPARLSVVESYFSDFVFWRGVGIDGVGGGLAQIPFEPFGIIALAILFMMAATSHDFWLKFLGASFWKKLHVFVYLAYASLIIHISFGFLQSERHSALVGLLGAGALGLATLHVLAYRKDRRTHQVQHTLNSLAAPKSDDGFHFACPRSDLTEGHGRVVTIEAQKIALFLHQGQVSAVSNICRHQGGPIGEGRIVDGCITCPWHGWQYRPEDGCSPPPFQEKLSIFATRVENDAVYVQVLARAVAQSNSTQEAHQ